MELIEGPTLKQYMKQKGKLSYSESVNYARQVAKALSLAHSKRVIHRDIKPQNIMITPDGTAKVADFGIAYQDKTQATAKKEKTAVGSVHYISPEQARGQPADARSDIYSLGIVMYEMLTGFLPFTGDTAEEIALQHVSATPVSLRELDPSIPAELERITLKAMNAEIRRRYQSADKLLADLEKYQQRQSESQEQEGLYRMIPRDVDPIVRTGEMSREKYVRRRRRANKVSLLSGFFLVILFMLSVFVFLWNYWLGDVFSDPVRINVPDFVGSMKSDVVDNAEFKKIYRFTVTEVIDPKTAEGEIIAQDPEGGKSVMQTDQRVRVQLTVSRGAAMVDMPDVVNLEYRDAISTLIRSSFEYELEYELSSEVSENYVISSSPGPGEQLPAGSRVYLTVSAGAVAKTVDMPNLIGLSSEAAVTRLESNRLVLGDISTVASDLQAGTVVGQSIEAGVQVNEHTKIFLQISGGPDFGTEISEEETSAESDTGG